MTKSILANLLLSFLLSAAYPSALVMGQSAETSPDYPLPIDLPFADLPFQQDAARAGELFDSFSMQQALSVTQTLHRANYHFNNRLWHKVIRPDSRGKKILNRIAANATSGLVDYVFTYYGVVLSPQWLHEEFHRAGLTIRGISSYDETYNRFNGGFANGSVSRVKDEDLVRLKREAPGSWYGALRPGSKANSSCFGACRGIIFT